MTTPSRTMQGTGLLLMQVSLATLLAACALPPQTIRPTAPVKPTPPTTPIEVPTFVTEDLVPPSPCPTTTLEGDLVPDDRWGVAVRDASDRVHQVIWPAG